MKIIRDLTEEEVTTLVPSELLDALNSPSNDGGYCGKCDGIRNHTTETCPREHGIYNEDRGG